jgi:hypothetical protein
MAPLAVDSGTHHSLTCLQELRVEQGRRSNWDVNHIEPESGQAGQAGACWQACMRTRAGAGGDSSEDAQPAAAVSMVGQPGMTLDSTAAAAAAHPQRPPTCPRRSTRWGRPRQCPRRYSCRRTGPTWRPTNVRAAYSLVTTTRRRCIAAMQRVAKALRVGTRWQWHQNAAASSAWRTQPGQRDCTPTSLQPELGLGPEPPAGEPAASAASAAGLKSTDC